MAQSNGVADGELVAGIFAGNVALESQLVQKYRTRLVTMLNGMTRDESRAEDLAHDTLLVVLKRLRESGIENPEKLTSYVFSTAKFLYLGWLRKMDNKIELSDAVEDWSCQEGDTLNLLFNDEIVEILDEALQKLKMERDREIISRHYLLDQSKPEVCDAMCLSTTHYDRVISRARHRLQGQLSVELLSA